MIIKAIIIFAVIFTYKLSVNIINYVRIKRLKDKYIEWLVNGKNNIGTYQSTVRKLIEQAGIEDSFIPTSQPMGFGQIATFKASILRNFPSRYQDQAIVISQMFDNAIGVYRDRARECFNPLYWIGAILFLPKNILSYIGLDPEKSLFKILNIFCSLIWWIFITLIAIFQDELKVVIIDLLKISP